MAHPEFYPPDNYVIGKDGQDVPDVMTTLLDYPETDKHPAFQVTLRVNFISGAGSTGATKFSREWRADG